MLPHSKNVFVNKASGAQKWSLVLGRIPLHQKAKNNINSASSPGIQQRSTPERFEQVVAAKERVSYH